ncbi:Protein C2-DOMAIN ABA-RELATED [Seminavis robusta]|uniref:Protein C2-DOMAIN ABA-RELATED n=1 Tax=Seminavis robusta TaxID=568900 RepID=A0A9N8D9I4_9STRA|nr:Protein C2-DOMAIN ABA-RELATED [Seminavis robusta]|eukprot:Sro24_g016350.1 Protein C2-DOMAIN ABA-RELATED (180) ;mRNA; f:49084-49723
MSMDQMEADLNILIEISSGRGLLIGDVKSSDPYVVVTMGKFGEVHKTKHISKTLNPEWGPEHKSTFILNVPSFKLVDSDGLTFTVKDYDMLSTDEDLGTVQLSVGDVMTKGSMDIMLERKITPPAESAGKDAGYLTIRIRKATPEDAQSLAKGEKKRLFAIKTGVFDGDGKKGVHDMMV